MSIYLYAAIGIGCAAVGAAGAWQTQEWRYGAKEAARLEAIERDRRFAEKRVDVAAGGHEADKSELRTEFVEIVKEVERVVEKPVYRDACLDDDGLRVLRAAIDPAPAASQPAPALPGSSAAR